jgi:ComF family protein
MPLATAIAGARRRALRLGRGIERTLMPRRCVFCGVAGLATEQFLCPGCDADLPRLQNPCKTCGMPMGFACPVPCARCQALPPPFYRVVAPLAYAFPVDAAIKAFKFQRKLYFGPAFANLLLQAADRLPDDIDAILPVPLHRWRKLRRGYNQAVEIALPVAKRLRLPVLSNVVRAVATPYQSGLDAAERAKNLRAAFQLRGTLSAKHVLLVDDVMTTGATCRQLAELMLSHGTTRCSVLVLARA